MISLFQMCICNVISVVFVAWCVQIKLYNINFLTYLCLQVHSRGKSSEKAVFLHAVWTRTSQLYRHASCTAGDEDGDGNGAATLPLHHLRSDSGVLKTFSIAEINI